MAYDLVSGKSQFIKDNPIIIGSLEYEEYPLVCKILKLSNHQVFNKLADLYSDSKFTQEEINQAQTILFEIMLSEIDDNLKNFVYKLIAIFSLALNRKYPLFGVAD